MRSRGTRVFMRAAMAVLVLTASACKEEVSAPLVLEVFPEQLELKQRETQQIVVNVVGQDSAAVSYSTSNDQVATVDGDGVVTAVGEGSATILITATNDPRSKTAVPITVTPVDAEVSIKSVTRGATFSPVDPESVAGRIDVTLSVERGTSDSLIVMVNNDVVESCTQAFGSVAMTPAAVQAQTAREIICSINTAAYTIDGTSSSVRYPNGQYTVTVQLLQGDEALDGARTAAMTFENEDFIAAWAEAPNTAVSEEGLVWHGGTVTATAVPVQYGSGETVTTINFSAYSSVRQDADGTDGFVVTFPADADTGGETDGLFDVEDDDFLIDVRSLTADNQPGPDATTEGEHPFRLDNGPPAAGTFFLTEQDLQLALTPICCDENWVRSAYEFVNGKDGEDDNGVGLVATNPVTFHVGDAGSDDETVIATAAVTSAASLTQSSQNDAYRVVALIQDRLGNRSIVPLQGDGDENDNQNQHGAVFGVDNTSPDLAFSGGALDEQVFNIAAPPAGEEFVMAAKDTATVGAPLASGLDSHPVVALLNRWFPELTDEQECYAPSEWVNFSTCEGRGVQATGGVANVAMPTDDGYYTLNAYSVDRAGNLSESISRMVLVDQTVPSADNIGIPTLVSGGNVTFTSQARDNLNLGTVQFRLQFDAAATLPFGNPVTINDQFPAELVTETEAAETMVFVRALETTDGVDAPTGPGTLNAATDVHMWLRDAARNKTEIVNGFAATTVEAGESFASDGDGTRVVDKFSVTTSTATSIEVEAEGNNASGSGTVLAVPFARVHFYYVDLAGDAQYLGSVASSDDPDSDEFVKRIRWTLNGDFADLSGMDIFAVGVHTEGDALMSNTVVMP